MVLKRLSTDTSKGFKSGKYHGSVYDETTNKWTYFTFPHLEASHGVIYGTPLHLPGNHTLRGIYSSTRIILLITRWAGSNSTITAYKGLISSSTGSLFGIKVSTGVGEDELMDIEDAFASMSALSNEILNFRFWRAAEEVPLDSEHVVGPSLMGNAETDPGCLRLGTWTGLWTFEDPNGGDVDAEDCCEWWVRVVAGDKVCGDGMCEMDGVKERFVFDGIVTGAKLEVYQTFATSLHLFIYQLKIESDGRVSGIGGASDETETNRFVLSFKK
ncbi:hypothetical protein HDU98_011412 [Podochytrium sp. JEL0797]|nr:hypothetical protein HDU98_011412 [Podochytrium sp. JEL0797]